ncbi:MAG: hypothetical protein V2A79_04380, partial [Planctomycetota bacterium]
LSPWAGGLTVWSTQGSVYPAVFPNGAKYLVMYRDMIAGGSFGMLWCPLWLSYVDYYRMRGGDPKYPELWYDGRFGQNYMAGYFRFARCAGGDFTYSRNSRTDIAPQRPGNARDAVVCDLINSQGAGGMPDQFYQDAHMPGFQSGLDAVKLRRENNVGYGDGHVETHGQAGYIDSAGYLTWDGAGWVVWAGWVRNMY